MPIRGQIMPTTLLKSVNSNFTLAVHSPKLRHAKTMAIRVVEFSNGVTKLERFLHKNQHTQKKLLYFENWINGGLRRIIFILPLTLLMNNEIWLYFNAKNDLYIRQNDLKPVY
jgi:hypothetical protein